MTVGLNTVNLANAMLNVLRGTTFTGLTAYCKLHTGDPGSAGTANASATTTRPAVTFAAASGGVLAMSATISWASWSGGSETISHISLWDAATSGNCLASAQLGTARAVIDGDTLNLTALTVALTPLMA